MPIAGAQKIVWDLKREADKRMNMCRDSGATELYVI